METRTCKGPVCQGKAKPISEFCKDSQRHDGISFYCRECRSHYHKVRYATPEGYKAKYDYNEKFYQTTAGREAQRSQYLKQVAKRPNHRKARAAVNNAIANGRLPRASTFMCSWHGCDKKAREYHHSSYEPEHWLNVTPYCSKHHKVVG